MDPQEPIFSESFPSDHLSSSGTADTKSRSKKSGHWLTIASVAVFILLALSAVVFLYYQNQKLKNMLANYQKQTVLSPSPTSTPTPNPTLTWKVYTNNKYAYEFMCPPTSTYKVTLKSGNGNDKPLYEEMCYEGQNQITISVYPLSSAIGIDQFLDGSKAVEKDSSKNKIFLRGFDNTYFEQILPTFKFITPTRSPTPTPTIPISAPTISPYNY